MGNGVQAATRRERADQFVFGKVERIRRLVEKHLATIANNGECTHPLHEIAHIVRRNLDAFRLARRARRENNILRFLAAHPHIARGRVATRKRIDKRSGIGKARDIEHAIGGDVRRQCLRQRCGAHDEGRIELREDIADARCRKLYVDRHEGMAAFQTAKEACDHAKIFMPENHDRETVGRHFAKLCGNGVRCR